MQINFSIFVGIILSLIWNVLGKAHKACGGEGIHLDHWTRDYLCLYDCMSRANIQSCAQYRAIPLQCNAIYDPSTRQQIQPICNNHQSCSTFCSQTKWNVGDSSSHDKCYWQLISQPNHQAACGWIYPPQCDNVCNDFYSCGVKFCDDLMNNKIEACACSDYLQDIFVTIDGVDYQRGLNKGFCEYFGYRAKDLK